MMKKLELDKILTDCLVVAEETGQLLLKFQEKVGDLKITTKHAQGVVSTADYQAEKKILSFLKNKYPQSDFLAEESVYLEHHGKIQSYKNYLEKDWLWIIDPLDGTNNFLNGLSYYAVSIALCIQGEVVLGLIHRPTSGEFFFATQNQPTQFLKNRASRRKSLNSQKNPKRLKDCLFATGFIMEKGHVDDQEFALFREMMRTSRGLRRMGSACLDLSYVAKGSFDGFWERGLPPWDIAAAQVICKNAGVKVTNYEGRDFEIADQGIIAARSPVHGKLFKTLKQSLS